MKVKLNDVIEIVNRTYGKEDIPQDEIEKFAEDLLDIILDEEYYYINEIFIVAAEFEQNMIKKGYKIYDNGEFELYWQIVFELLGVNEDTVVRLMESFFDYDKEMITFKLLSKYFQDVLSPLDKLRLGEVVNDLYERLGKHSFWAFMI